MRWATTIAATVLVGSLTTSTAEASPLSTTSPPAPTPTSRVDRPDRAGAAPLERDTWSVDLSAGEGAGVTLVSGAARLDPAGVFLAPLEGGREDGAAGSGSTGADPGRGGAGTGATRSGRTGSGGTTAAPTAGTAVPTGLLTLPVQRLNGSTRRVDSTVVGVVPTGSTATVDVRGRGADGSWSEWIPTGGERSAKLPRPAVAVQSRLVLTGQPGAVAGGPAGPEVRSVTLTAHPLSRPTTPGPSPTTTSVDPTPTATTQGDASPTSSPAAGNTTPTATPSAAPTTGPTTTADDDASTTATSTPSAGAAPAGPGNAPLSYRVFATREGLTGRTTANGHKIKSSDRFVALPSRRALSPRGRNDYSVKVCAANGRCAVAPVWDVGPWNTRDDYWNPPSRRQEWRDLPQGMPQAQAAKERGYNDGRDQFDREVLNPAGIDLSDDLFTGVLGLQDNGWVTVEYLWTGADEEESASAG